MAMSESAPRLAQLTLSELTGLRKRRSRMSATQVLWGRLENDASLLVVSANRSDLTSEDQFVLEQCRQKLELARDCIDRVLKRPFSFWELIHDVDSLLLLVLPEPLLATRALEVMQLFDQKVSNPRLRELWLGTDQQPGPLRDVVELLRRDLTPTDTISLTQRLTAEQLSRCRHVLRGALGIVNEHFDKGFWQLSLNVSIQILSAVLLLGLLVATILLFEYRWFHLDIIQARDICPYIVSGMAGAILSNMLSRDRFLVATGATARYFVYYLFVKPLIGGFAALLLIFLERAGLLISVVVSHNGNVQSAESIVLIVVASQPAAFFARAALSLASGFSADRMLSTMMDTVLGKLLKESEKGVLSPSGPGENPSPPPANAREEARA